MLQLVSTYGIIPGGEPFSFAGEGDRARVGVAVIHGFCGNPITTRPLGEFLAQRGYRVEVPRLPGHATDWREMGRTRYRDWRAAVVDVLDDLLRHSERVVLAGLSMGGTLVLDVASQRAEVAGVIAVNPTVLDRTGVVARIAPLVARFIPAVPGRAAGLVKNDAAKPGVDEKAYDWVPTQAAQSLLEQLPRIRSALGELRAPALVAYSPQDHSVPPENSTAIPQLAGSEVTLLPLERSFHLATLDYDQGLLQQRVAEFIERVTEPQAAQREVQPA